MRLQSRARERIDRKLTLEWYTSLVDLCLHWWVAFPCSHWPWDFFLWTRGEDVRWWKCMRVGLQSTKWAILLAKRTHWEWWLVGVHNENTRRRGFLSECYGFSLNSVHGSQIEDFLWILCQGARVFTYSANIKFPNSCKNSKDSHSQAKGDHHNTNAGVKISLFIAEIPNIPSTN
jgi:hypothetical protein